MAGVNDFLCGAPLLPTREPSSMVVERTDADHSSHVVACPMSHYHPNMEQILPVLVVVVVVVVAAAVAVVVVVVVFVARLAGWRRSEGGGSTTVVEKWLGWPLRYLDIFPNLFHKDPVY